jgi:hypothetical protein
MNKSNNEEKIISLLKSTHRSIRPSPVFKDKMLNILLSETQAALMPIGIGFKVMVSSLIVIAIILVVYGYFAASAVK